MLSIVGVFVISTLLFSAVDVQQIEEKHEEDCTKCRCTPGWDCHFNSYYKYIPNAMRWIDAEFYCQKLYPSAHLASIHSEDENDFLKKITFKKTNSYPLIWVGGSDCYKDRSFVWTDGSSWDYQNWRHGEPNNNGGREACLNFNFATAGLWNDEYCEKMFPFLCKYTTSWPY
ncbi:lectin-like [Pleurodeles waltl]|uniref:lectin-like n=1 Tax=Pleurodeles waltl TaxID=8319 RepID=UPI0037094B02